jgi:eukaryotic-like serine/threonine-protein kinase
MSLTPATRLGQYVITAQIGLGGMGEVYSATDTVLKRQVALKVLPDVLAVDVERLARLRREAEVLASLNHPNIAAVYGLEQAQGTLALVMELIEGPTLADRIAENAIPLDEALPIARQIADALEAAHEQGVIHRDLKPANIKIRADGTVKLLDFGLAKPLEEVAGTASADVPGASPSRMVTSPAMMTQAGMILGTAAYMAPEQAKGKPADKRSDIWAFGVIVAEMTTGRTLFEGETIAETIAAVLTREPDLDGLPPALRRLVRLCLVKDPRARLRHIGDALAVVDESPSIVSPKRATRVEWWAYAIPLFTLAALGIAVAVWSVFHPRNVEEAVTSFYLDAPPGAAFNYTYTATAISPDGRQLVFRVAMASEAPGLWLRPLDTLEGRRMAGTDGADFPFWSPDGRSVGFFSAGKLKRVDTSGSTPIVLCDAPDADVVLTGGSWNQDGVIIFGAPEGIYRVSASGGTPALIARANNASGETGYGSPQFLPDGDRFLMFVRSPDPARNGYYVSSLSRPDQKRRLLATWNKAVFVANDAGGASYLVYLQDRTVLARRLDRRTLTLDGDPVPVVSDVALFPPGFHASFWLSASGNLLAYRTEASDRPRLTWVYPDGKRQTITGTEDFYTHVRISRDGSRAAVELADGAGNMDIWTWDFARHVKTRQTFDPKPDRSPSWAPNGHEIAFSSLRTGVWQIFRKNVTNGRPEEQLTTGVGDKIVPGWSQDGRYLLFIHIGTTTAEDIWALSLQGNREPFPVLQTPAIETNPSLSPDGQWLAFESAHSGRPEVYVTRFPASRNGIPATAPRWQVSTQGGSRPRWSSDGRAVFYVSLDDHGIMRAEVRTGEAGFESDAPRVFADIPVMSVARSPFDVTEDGRLLLLERTINQGARLALITNWRTAMARR